MITSSVEAGGVEDEHVRDNDMVSDEFTIKLGRSEMG